MRNPRHAPRHCPELLGRRPSDQTVLGDLAALQKLDQCLIAGAGLERTLFISNKPWPHRVVRGLAAEWLVQSTATAAAVAAGLRFATIWADDYLGFRHQYSPSSILARSRAPKLRRGIMQLDR